MAFSKTTDYIMEVYVVISKRIVSLIMSIVIAVTAFVPTFAYSMSKEDVACDRVEIMTLSDYKEKLREEGFPVITTDQFLKITSCSPIVLESIRFLLVAQKMLVERI